MLLITITGPSGAGKDTLAHILQSVLDCNIIVSYTTRPMREGEEDGREHHFVSHCDVSRKDMIAYTCYGGYEYWATKDQIGQCSVYIIDEDGLRYFSRHHPNIPVLKIYITTPYKDICRRGVDFKRLQRDDGRELFPREYYDVWIDNNGTIEVLKEKVFALRPVLLRRIAVTSKETPQKKHRK